MRPYTRSDWTLLVLVLLATLLFGQVILPFILDILIAVILASVFWFMYSFLSSRLSNKPVAALVSIVIILLIIIIPLMIIVYMISLQTLNLFYTVQQQWPAFQEALSNLDAAGIMRDTPLLRNLLPVIEEFDLGKRLLQGLPQAANLLIDFIQGVLTNIYNLAFHTIIMLVLLYYFFVDGRHIFERVRQVLPLSNDIFDDLVSESKKVINSTVVGTLLIALIYGVSGAAFFLLLGIPSPLFWSVIMFILSILPLIGAFIVYIGAGLVYLILGSYGMAIALFLIGIAGTQFVENIVRPKMVGSSSGMNPGLVLVATLGGLIWIGPIGLIIGPLIGAVFIAAWVQFGKVHAAYKGR